MNDKEELKQIYDIFTDCWRLYKKLYPPGRLKDEPFPDAGNVVVVFRGIPGDKCCQ